MRWIYWFPTGEISRLEHKIALTLYSTIHRDVCAHSSEATISVRAHTCCARRVLQVLDELSQRTRAVSALNLLEVAALINRLKPGTRTVNCFPARNKSNLTQDRTNSRHNDPPWSVSVLEMVALINRLKLQRCSFAVLFCRLRWRSRPFCSFLSQIRLGCHTSMFCIRCVVHLAFYCCFEGWYDQDRILAYHKRALTLYITIHLGVCLYLKWLRRSIA